MANTRLSDLSVGGAIASTDLFYGVETAGVGGVQKDGAQFAEYIRDIYNASIQDSATIEKSENDPTDTISFSIVDGSVDTAQLADDAVTADKIDGADAANILALLSAPDTAIGTWTPTFSFATNGDLSNSYTNQSGYYIRVGDMVFVYCVLQWTPTFTTASSLAQIGGLPFTVKTDGILFVGGGVIVTLNTAFTWPTGTTNPMITFNRDSNVINIRGNGTGINSAFFVTTNFSSGSAHTIQLAGVYERD